MIIWQIRITFALLRLGARKLLLKGHFMDIIFSMILTFLLLIFSIYRGIFIGYPLIFGLLVFSFLAWQRGRSVKGIYTMSYQGGKKSFIVLRIFVLIGAVTASWMASGTVPGIVYYGIKLMNAHYFFLSAFLICAAVSFLLGSSFGTISTVGLALIVMAKGGNVNVDLAAGAIIAGAYFGDHCSPMSSSANLVANLTETRLYTNIGNILKTIPVPLIISLILYTLVSQQQPLNFAGSNLDTAIMNAFRINWIVLIPAVIILIFSLLRVEVKVSMLVSIIVAAILSVTVQHYKPVEVIKYIILGFEPVDGPLQNVIQGGGIIAMLKPALIVFISCALAGIFNGTQMLKSVEVFLMKARTRFQLFLSTALVSFVTAAFGCTQSIAIVLTSQLMKKPYQEQKQDQTRLALDIENTAIVLAALIPWNIGAYVPAITLNVSVTGFIPYAFYLYLIPLFNLLFYKYHNSKVQP